MKKKHGKGLESIKQGWKPSQKESLIRSRSEITVDVEDLVNSFIEDIRNNLDRCYDSESESGVSFSFTSSLSDFLKSKEILKTHFEDKGWNVGFYQSPDYNKVIRYFITLQ